LSTTRWIAWRRWTPRMAQVVEMRYFGGLSEPEIALALGVTDRTVRRDWEKARLLLREALE
jgi:DNA-directed RNA polymerase specialized sigma24 family protein